MTAVQNPLETLDYVTATAVPTNAGAAEQAILSTDVVQAYANPADEQPGSENISPQAVRPVIIEANLNITPGTTTTSVTVKCRQGVGLAGAALPVGFAHTLAAGNTAQLHCKFRDTSGVPFAPGGTAYTVTVTQTAGTAAGAVNAIDVEVKQ